MMDAATLPIHLEFEQPVYLLLLALVPLVVYSGLRAFTCLEPFRRAAVIVLRCLLIVLFAFALADPTWVRTTDDQTIIFAVDQSDSVPEELREHAMAFMERAVRSMRPDKDRVAGVGFAGFPAIWQRPATQLVTHRLPLENDRQHTDIAAAMKIGLGLFPTDTAKRIVLVSDGNENRGLSEEVARTYAALGIPVDVLPLEYEHGAEILVEKLSAPASVDLDETFEVQLLVRSQRATTAQLFLYHNESLVDLDPRPDVDSKQIRLHAGANRFGIPTQLPAAGINRFQVVIRPDDPAADTLPMNNQGRAFTIVGEAERVIIVMDPLGAHAGDDAESLVRALREGGIEPQIVPISELSADPITLADCSAIILSNISAFSLGENVQAMLASFVQDQGGGLIAVGGDNSFSVGGYAHTPLETILPVETDRDRLKVLSLSMVIVIDRSGSMAGDKLGLALQAAKGSVQLLGRLDRIGVIAFDGYPQWIVPIQSAAGTSRIVQSIDTILSGGGTDLYPALEWAYKALIGEDTNLRHIILLTDGQSQAGDYAGLAEKCREAAITVSTVAVGQDADRALLARIAADTRGRAYVAENAKPLPKIFVHETVLASRSGVVEKPFVPAVHPTIGDSFLKGFSQADLPPLGGYVVTAAKALATTPLVRANGEELDPILACWQVGLGRSVAFTSGLWTRWGAHWAEWSGFSKLWTQAVRYVGRAGDPSQLDVESSFNHGEGHVVVSAEHLPRDKQVSLSLTGRLILPDFSTRPLNIERTSLGRFEAKFPADMRGTYLVNMAYSRGEGDERQTGTLQTGVVAGYSAEYAALRPNQAILADLARHTGGRILTLDFPERVFESSSIRPVDVRRPVWDLLVWAALPVFLLDVAIRRLAVTPADVLGRVSGWLDGLTGRRVAVESVATLSSLRRVRGKVTKHGMGGEATGTEAAAGAIGAAGVSGEDSGPRPRPTARFDAGEPVEDIGSPVEGLGPATGSQSPLDGSTPNGRSRTDSGAEKSRSPSGRGDSAMSRLLKAKRRLRDDQENS